MIEIESMVEKRDLENAPKVSAKVREYVWMYIYERLLIPRKIMVDTTYDYRFTLDLTYIIHSGFISGYQNRYGDNLKPPTNVYHRMTA